MCSEAGVWANNLMATAFKSCAEVLSAHSLMYSKAGAWLLHLLISILMKIQPKDFADPETGLGPLRLKCKVKEVLSLDTNK